jgi:hypothetical protein
VLKFLENNWLKNMPERVPQLLEELKNLIDLDQEQLP